MRWSLTFVFAAVLAAGLAAQAGCSAISAEVRAVAEPEVPYAVMLAHAQEYVGKTVILGGYILKADSDAAESVLVVLQAPLDFSDLPGEADATQGRFLVVHSGFLDPAIFRRGRRLTVGGQVTSVTGKSEECPARCVEVEARELHLWDGNLRGPAWAVGGAYLYYPYGYYPYGTYSPWGPRMPRHHSYPRYRRIRRPHRWEPGPGR